MIRMQRPGISSLQDTGRKGLQHLGIGVSGAMDQFAARVANAALANDLQAAVIEFTLIGAELHIQNPQWFVITGANCQPSADGLPLPMCKPFFLEAGQVLVLKNTLQGCRSYLAVQGGFQGHRQFGSVATDTRAGLGGLCGKNLQKDDVVSFNTELSRIKNQSIAWQAQFANPAYAETQTLAIIPGRFWHKLTSTQQHEMLVRSWHVSKDSDRMGLRLNEALGGTSFQQSLLSSAVAFGSIQLPPDNRPILLAADRQTTGGYPLLGTLATVSHAGLAQAKPGDTLHFKQVTCDAAQQQWLQRERAFGLWQQQIQHWWRYDAAH